MEHPRKKFPQSLSWSKNNLALAKLDKAKMTSISGNNNNNCNNDIWRNME